MEPAGDVAPPPIVRVSRPAECVHPSPLNSFSRRADGKRCGHRIAKPTPDGPPLPRGAAGVESSTSRSSWTWVEPDSVEPVDEPTAGRRTVPGRRADEDVGGPRCGGTGGGRCLLLGGLIVANSCSWITSRSARRTTAGTAHCGPAGEAAVRSPIGSLSGSGYRPGAVYAHHPPLIVAMTAAGRFLGSSALVDRLPAILSSTAALLLLVALLRALRCSTGATVAGLVAMAAAPMFLVYGTMVDTLVIALPFGIAGPRRRSRPGRSTAPPAVVHRVALGRGGVQASHRATHAAASSCTRSIDTDRDHCSGLAGGALVSALLAAGAATARVGPGGIGTRPPSSDGTG